MQYIPWNRCYGANHPQADPGNAPPTRVETITQTKDCRINDQEGEMESLRVHCAKSHQLCPTLCDPIDGSPPGSPVPGILQARTLEWVAISFSNAGK